MRERPANSVERREQHMAEAPKDSLRSSLVVGAIWRRKRTGALVRITRLDDTSSNWNNATYFDISWETVDKPRRRGQSYEDYWLRDLEPVDVAAA